MCVYGLTWLHSMYINHTGEMNTLLILCSLSLKSSVNSSMHIEIRSPTHFQPNPMGPVYPAIYGKRTHFGYCKIARQSVLTECAVLLHPAWPEATFGDRGGEKAAILLPMAVFPEQQCLSVSSCCFITDAIGHQYYGIAQDPIINFHEDSEAWWSIN